MDYKNFYDVLLLVWSLTAVEMTRIKCVDNVKQRKSYSFVMKSVQVTLTHWTQSSHKIAPFIFCSLFKCPKPIRGLWKTNTTYRITVTNSDFPSIVPRRVRQHNQRNSQERVSDNSLGTVAASIPPAPWSTRLSIQPEVVPAKHASLWQASHQDEFIAGTGWNTLAKTSNLIAPTAN